MHSRFTNIQKADVISQYWRGKPVAKICEEYKSPDTKERDYFNRIQE